MTTVTDADIKKIEGLIVGLGDSIGALSDRLTEVEKKMSVGFAELSGKIDTTNVKVEALDKRLTETNTNLEKRLTESITALEKNVEKRLTNQEFVYRAVIISILVSFVGGVFKFLWQAPF